jgi:hypothetical protein
MCTQLQVAHQDHGHCFCVKVRAEAEVIACFKQGKYLCWYLLREHIDQRSCFIVALLAASWLVAPRISRAAATAIVQ